MEQDEDKIAEIRKAAQEQKDDMQKKYNDMIELNLKLKAKMEWKPISTAPKDEFILIYSKGFGPTVGFGGNWEEVGLTHWMPLPDPPKD